MTTAGMKHRLAAACAMFALWLAPLPEAQAAREWEGMDLVRYCTGETVLFDESICRAYLQGILDAHDYYQLEGKHPKAFCLPKDKAAREKGEKLVPLWLADFPERYEDSSIELAIDALSVIFRCDTRQK